MRNNSIFKLKLRSLNEFFTERLSVIIIEVNRSFFQDLMEIGIPEVGHLELEMGPEMSMSKTIVIFFFKFYSKTLLYISRKMDSNCFLHI